jgi:hypothetical protein
VGNYSKKYRLFIGVCDNPFTRSRIQLRSPKPLDARPIAPEAGTVMHLVLRIVRLAAEFAAKIEGERKTDV